MKPFDRVEVKQDVPEQEVSKGMTGVIVDFNQSDEGLEAVIELDDRFIEDPDEDEPTRNVEVKYLTVIASS